jgi:hypothetical protein
MILACTVYAIESFLPLKDFVKTLSRVAFPNLEMSTFGWEEVQENSTTMLVRASIFDPINDPSHGNNFRLRCN